MGGGNAEPARLARLTAAQRTGICRDPGPPGDPPICWMEENISPGTGRPFMRADEARQRWGGVVHRQRGGEWWGNSKVEAEQQLARRFVTDDSPETVRVGGRI